MHYPVSPALFGKIQSLVGFFKVDAKLGSSAFEKEPEVEPASPRLMETRPENIQKRKELPPKSYDVKSSDDALELELEIADNQWEEF